MPNIYHTPLIAPPILAEAHGAPLWLKCENMQQTHSFKARGAWNAVSKLRNPERGVITHSSGNHGQALAWAARIHHIPAHIVVPENAPQVKIDAIRRQGGIIHFCDAGIDAREEMMNAIRKEGKQTFIPPYNHEDVIEGQRSCGEEIVREQPQLDFLLVPVGGGGLLSGCALAVNEHSPNTKVYGCEPENADDARKSFHSGTLHHPGNPDTIADGLRTGLGDITFGYIQKYVTDIYTVSEDEIHQAWAYAVHQLKLIIEPSCAVPLAVWKKHSLRWRGKSGAMVITGGNVDLTKLPSIDDSLGFL